MTSFGSWRQFLETLGWYGLARVMVFMPRCESVSKVIRIALFTLGFCVSGSLLILLLGGSRVERLTVPVLLRITSSGVNGRPVRITFDTDQKVICSGVNGALSVKLCVQQKIFRTVCDRYRTSI